MNEMSQRARGRVNEQTQIGGKSYLRNQQEVKERKQRALEKDRNRSAKHYVDFQSNVKRMEERRNANRYRDSDRINSALQSFSSKIELGV